MDLQKIAESNKNWIISKNIIYVDYITKIPMLIKKGDDIWVYLDIKIAKHVLKLVKILSDKNINFLFKSTLIFFDEKFTEEEFHKHNLKQYLKNITDKKFFDGFEKIGFDFTQNLAQYLVKYQCFEIFQQVYQKQKSISLSKTYDYWVNKEYYTIDREDIRNYISSLEREIKISLLF
jgi:hypothetical protein